MDVDQVDEVETCLANALGEMASRAASALRAHDHDRSAVYLAHLSHMAAVWCEAEEQLLRAGR